MEMVWFRFLVGEVFGVAGKRTGEGLKVNSSYGRGGKHFAKRDGRFSPCCATKE